MKPVLIALIICTSIITGCGRVDLSEPKQRTSYALGRSIGDSYKQRKNIDSDSVSDAIADFPKGQNRYSSASDKQSYDLGWSIGKMITAYSVDFDRSAFMAGFNEELKNRPNRLSNKEMTELLATMEKKAQETQMKMSGEFFSSKTKESDIITTASGLRYKIITRGTGARPLPDAVVRVHYKGSFVNGVEFDSSYKMGQPLDVNLKQVIKGWQEGLPLMQEGATYVFYIPSDLAYGKTGRGMIPGNAALVFEIHLIKVVQK